MSTDVTAPATPSGFSAAAVMQGVRLSWTANAEDDLAGYEVYRATSNSFGASALVWSGRATTFADRAVSYGTTYYYWVKAVDRSENKSAESSSVSAAPSKVGSGDIDDSAIVDAKIQDGAVSNTSVAYSSGTVSAIGTSWAQIQSVGITSEGSVVFVHTTFAAANNDVANTFFNLRVLRDGSTIYSASNLSCLAYAKNLFSVSMAETPSSGAHTYSVEVQQTSALSAAFDVDSRTLLLMEIKK